MKIWTKRTIFIAKAWVHNINRTRVATKTLRSLLINRTQDCCSSIIPKTRRSLLITEGYGLCEMGKGDKRVVALWGGGGSNKVREEEQRLSATTRWGRQGRGIHEVEKGVAPARWDFEWEWRREREGSSIGWDFKWEWGREREREGESECEGLRDLGLEFRKSVYL